MAVAAGGALILGPGVARRALGAPGVPPAVVPAPKAAARPAAKVAAGSAAPAVPVASGTVPVPAVSVTVANPSSTPRPAETVVVDFAALARVVPGLDPSRTVVVDAAGRPVESQLVDSNGDDIIDQILFQTPLGAGETRSFQVRSGLRPVARPEAWNAFGRFARERHDDFAWENDRIAHRMYGPDLETWKKEPLTSSGIDVWSKRVDRLVINDWYLTDDYHADSGEGADLYSVGKSRGCGGLGVWGGGRLWVSRNFRTSRVLANGPLRVMFELGYAPFEAGGVTVAETKRITLDAHHNYDLFQSRFRVVSAAPGKTPAPLNIAVGIARHAGGTFEFDAERGLLRSWEPMKDSAKNGELGCGVVLWPGSPATQQTTESDALIVTPLPVTGAVTYRAGFGWDRSGDVADKSAWFAMVDSWAAELAAPVKVDLSAAAPSAPAAPAEARSWAARTCDAIMARHPGAYADKWSYETGLILKAFLEVWRRTNDARYFTYAKDTVDRLLDGEGEIRGYRAADYNLDQINMGKVLFPLLAEARKEGRAQDVSRYKHALGLLREQLRKQPRTSEGGFWHKQIYARQMWLDGLYMASPFLVEYGVTFNEPTLIDDAVRQITLVERHLRDPRTGLLYHGWDESRQQQWADPKTGRSSQFWGRSVGWFAMAVVDVLEAMPANHPRRAVMLGVLRRLAPAIASVQDKMTGVWWQVLDAGPRDGNYVEASASSMFVYALGKAVRLGWLDGKRFGPVVATGWDGILARFVETDTAGAVNLKNICKVAGLGGNPYRDGSYEYYTQTPIVTNDPKGLGAFVLAATEQETKR